VQELRDKFLRCRAANDLSGLDESRLKKDVLRYIDLAHSLSVDDTSILNGDQFLVDSKVRLKCRVPLCRHYGTCLNCPPHTRSVDETKEVISGYKTGILLRWKYPRKEVLNAGANIRRSIFKTISAIEAAAFYDGYYFACGLAAGSCRSGLCNNMECQSLTSPEKGCRHPLLARPSMEAMGFDVYGMASNAGWEIFPAGRNCPEEVKTLNRIGLVLIV